MAVSIERWNASLPTPPVVFNYELAPFSREDPKIAKAEDTMMMGFQVLRESGVWGELAAAKDRYLGNAGRLTEIGLVSPQDEVAIELGDNSAFMHKPPPKVLSGYALLWPGIDYDPAFLGQKTLYHLGFYVVDGTFLTNSLAYQLEGAQMHPERIYDYASKPMQGNFVNINSANPLVPRIPILHNAQLLPKRELAYPKIQDWVRRISEERFRGKVAEQSSDQRFIPISPLHVPGRVA